MNYIGADPGTANYAYSVIECKRTSINILEIGMVQSTITNLTKNHAKPPKSKRKKKQPIILIPPFDTQFKEYKATWDILIAEFKPVKITVERFQSRGYQGSQVIEAVSMMNGILSALAYASNVEYENHIAGTWKNNLNKYLSNNPQLNLSHLEEIYESCNSIPNHVVDSIFINLYGMLRHKSKAWSDLNLVKLIKDIQKYEYIK